MSILAQLSSQTGDRSAASNRKVVLQIENDPELLAEIAAGLTSKDAALLGDCAEVLTQTADLHPDWCAPYAEALVPLLRHKNTRVRWEAVHALALIAVPAPHKIDPLLPSLAELIRTDASIIVRDYATDAVSNYAGSSPSAAQEAFPLLKEVLGLWGGKQAGHALKGLVNVARQIPALHPELRALAEEATQQGRAVVRKAAKDLLKACAG